jgi:hypothetical protein
MLARQLLQHLSHYASPFMLVMFKIGSYFMPWLAWTSVLLFVFPCMAGMTGMSHCTQLLVEMGLVNPSQPGWP